MRIKRLQGLEYLDLLTEFVLLYSEGEIVQICEVDLDCLD